MITVAKEKARPEVCLKDCDILRVYQSYDSKKIIRRTGKLDIL